MDGQRFDETIELSDMDAWDDFANNNRDALLEIYPDIDAAMKAACDGGIVMGGGAAPLFYIHFAG